ncbi:MAG TPA: VOC family protein [Acidimicrobiales bacterium]|nr:VOC family protein [Acidimicrobiales bacterium]
MEQRISLVTLGVRDLARAKRFYEALGWRGQEMQETVFFQTGGMALVLWGRDQLAADAAVADIAAAGAFDGVALAQNVRSREDVDRIAAEVAAAGGEVTKAPADTFYGGYAFYFRDPEGHSWEVAYNPGFTINADGTLTLPDFAAS